VKALSLHSSLAPDTTLIASSYLKGIIAYLNTGTLPAARVGEAME